MCCDNCCTRPEPVDESELQIVVEDVVNNFDFHKYDADVIATADSVDARMQLWRSALIYDITTAVVSVVGTA